MTKTSAATCLGALLLLAGGCSQQQHYFSGFLEDYSNLEPSRVEPGTLFYRDPDADLTRYNKIFVHPISVHFADPQDEAAVLPQRLKQYKQLVQDGLRDEFAKYNLNAPQPGNDVAELRFQVANMRRTRIIESPRQQYGARRYLLGSANAEAALVDGETRVVLTQYVGKTVSPEMIETWSEQEAWASLESHTIRAIERMVAIWAPEFAAATHPADTSSHEEDE